MSARSSLVLEGDVTFAGKVSIDGALVIRALHGNLAACRRAMWSLWAAIWRLPASCRAGVLACWRACVGGLVLSCASAALRPSRASTS